MARSRNIKPGFHHNDLLASKPPLTRLLFIALWAIADREGRLEDRPAKIKALCLPYDDIDVDAALADLASGDDPFIIRYEVGKGRYLQVINWHKHQTPHGREPESTIPEPESCTNLSTNPNSVEVSADAVPSPSQDAERRLRVSGISKRESAERERFSKWWESVPRKVGRGEAAKAYARAVLAIKDRALADGPGGDDPHGFLLERMTAFAASPKGQGDFCPHPATWLNQARYDDDPKAWGNARAPASGPNYEAFKAARTPEAVKNIRF
jgi:hypothetical protein